MSGKYRDGCSAGDISASGFDTGAMNTILFSLAIGETAGPSAAVKVPTMKSTSSFSTISRATRTASSALPLLSLEINCSFLPSTPPWALTSSTYICAPLSVGSPNSAPGPDRIMGIPILIWSAAVAASGDASNAAVASEYQAFHMCLPGGCFLESALPNVGGAFHFTF